MTKSRSLLYKILTAAVLVVIVIIMFIIGRGHYVYLDNKTVEINGTEYAAKYQIDVSYKGQKITELMSRERTEIDCMGQKCVIELDVYERRNSMSAEHVTFELEIPYDLDGVVINLPAYLAGLPQEDYMEEFIPAPEPDTGDDDVPGGDEFDISAE